MLKALQQIAILAMIAGSRPWKRLLTLFLMVFLAVITPWALSGCQPINIEAPPQPDVVTRALQETTDASAPTEDSGAPSVNRERAAPALAPAPASPMASDSNHLTHTQESNPPTTPPVELDWDDAELELGTAYDALVEGEFFHTIPEYMNAGQQLVIRAGVSKEVNKKLLTLLNITETESLTIIGNERFNPLRMELTLNGAENEFIIEPISDGIKLVIKDYPDMWEWLVTPQKSGNFPLRLTALVRLLDFHQGDIRQQELMLFSDSISIRPVPAYTWDQIIQNYFIPLAVLSFFIFCIFIGWLIAYTSHANHWGRTKLSASLQDGGISHEE